MKLAMDIEENTGEQASASREGGYVRQRDAHVQRARRSTESEREVGWTGCSNPVAHGAPLSGGDAHLQPDIPSLPPGSKRDKHKRRRLAVDRYRAHLAFDALWESGLMSRANAYRWLAWKFAMTEDEAHISKFTAQQCQVLVRILSGMNLS